MGMQPNIPVVKCLITNAHHVNLLDKILCIIISSSIIIIIITAKRRSPQHFSLRRPKERCTSYSDHSPT